LAAFGIAEPAGIFTAEHALHALVLGEELEFENRRFADDSLGALGIGLARQLDENRIASAALDDRLRKAELVDAVAHGLERLLDREFFDAVDLLLRQRVLELPRGDVGADPLVGRKAVLHDSDDLVGLPALGELDRDRSTAVARYPGDRNVGALELTLQILDAALDAEFDGLLGLHLEDEVHAALQVEAEADRLVREEGLPP